MNRSILVLALVAASSTLFAQQSSPSGQYQGTSAPPPDDTIITDTDQPPAKPSAAHPLTTPPDAMPQAAPAVQATQPAAAPATTLSTAPPNDLTMTSDPDGDIVHPAPLGPGEIGQGTLIRVRMLNDLSSSFSEKGEPFRSRVANDVLSGSNVVIPAGAEISGQVVETSTGHFGGRGSLMLKPDTVTLPNGQSFRLHAVVSGAPATHSRVDNEGMITADSRKLRGGIEYGGAVGAGAVTGAYLGGPVGALAGGLVGAGLVTTHLLISHPQAHLDTGDVLMLTVTERLHLDPVTNSGS
jgi:hypothetical protein